MSKNYELRELREISNILCGGTNISRSSATHSQIISRYTYTPYCSVSRTETMTMIDKHKMSIVGLSTFYFFLKQ